MSKRFDVEWESSVSKKKYRIIIKPNKKRGRHLYTQGSIYDDTGTLYASVEHTDYEYVDFRLEFYKQQIQINELCQKLDELKRELSNGGKP